MNLKTALKSHRAKRTAILTTRPSFPRLRRPPSSRTGRGSARSAPRTPPLPDAGRHRVDAVLHERGEPPDGENPLGVALERADLAVDALRLERQLAVEEHRVLDMGEGALAPVDHIAHGSPPFPRAARLRSACSRSSRARTTRASTSSRLADGLKNRAMLLFGILNDST